MIIIIDCEVVLIVKISSMSGIEVDKWCDIFPSEAFINWVSVMGRIQEELFNTEFREVCFHHEKGMEKRKHVMPGGSFQKRKYREVVVGIGSHIHVEAVTKEIAFLVGAPSLVTVMLGAMAFTVTERRAFSLQSHMRFFATGR